GDAVRGPRDTHLDRQPRDLGLGAEGLARPSPSPDRPALETPRREPQEAAPRARASGEGGRVNRPASNVRPSRPRVLRLTDERREIELQQWPGTADALNA